MIETEIKVIPYKIGEDGEVYYKCPTCGATGNWPEFIISERCHNSK